jgi:hypothetical protein
MFNGFTPLPTEQGAGNSILNIEKREKKLSEDDDDE